LKSTFVSLNQIYGIYKLYDITDSLLDDLKQKGINSIMIDLNNEYYLNIFNKIDLIKEKGLSVIVRGEGSENINIDGVLVGVNEKPGKNQRQIVSYNEANKILQENGSLYDIIITVTKQEGENIVLTPENIRKFIMQGAAFAFDGEVIRELNKETTAYNDFTMLDIIKAIFADKPEEKLNRRKKESIARARMLDIALTDREIDRLSAYIIEMRKLDGAEIADKKYTNVLSGYLDRASGLLAKYEVSKKIQTMTNIEVLGTFEGILQRIELENLFDNIEGEDNRKNNINERIENMNDLMQYNAEYRILTGHSYDPNKKSDLINSMKDLTEAEILRDLQNIFSEVSEQNSSSEDMAAVLEGIIEILLAKNIQLDKNIGNLIAVQSTREMFALLSAA
ncbi:MAG: hypothetical protein II816_04235, partial [Elusimicrobia bacterium]|nr:hypothetical protein [Elusimicrobiota bacterium]